MARKILALSLLILVAAAVAAPAGEHASVDETKSTWLQNKWAMEEFINRNTINSFYIHYDPVEGKLLRLQLDNLHRGQVRKGDFYVGSADFTDQHGRKVGLAFFVIRHLDNARVLQAVVHEVDGKEREYEIKKLGKPADCWP